MSAPHRPARPFLAFAGLVCVALGTLGIVLPGLPTTPFLLAASYFFARSSPRLQHWLTHHRWFGPYLRAIRDERGMPLRGKIVTLALLWGSIALSSWMLSRGDNAHPVLLTILLVCAIGVTALVLFVFRTLPLPPPDLSDDDQAETLPTTTSSGASTSDGDGPDADEPRGPSASEPASGR